MKDISDFTIDIAIHITEVYRSFGTFTKWWYVLPVKNVTTECRMWLEADFQRENVFWIWWAFSYSNQIILTSVNSEKSIDSEDRHQFTSMLDKMEIF